MPLFSSKIDPFSAFTINLGPLYVERVFDSLLTRQGVKEIGRIGAAERFGRYLEYLSERKDAGNLRQYAAVQFYKGHFYQQLAIHSARRDSAQHFQEKAVCYYQTYLELPARVEEGRYYAQWQTGLLLDALKYPWPLVEASLLKACAIDPLRGEAVKKMTGHYVHKKEWDSAYAYSTRALSQFFDKNPVAVRRWFIDFDAYNWTVIRTHRTICTRLGYITEKNTVSGTANNQTITQPDQL